MADKRVIFERLAFATLVAVFFLMLLGGYVKAIGAGLSCPTWPKCFHGQGMVNDLFPFAGADTYPWTMHQVASEWLHRFVAVVVGPMLIGTTWLAWRLKPADARVRFFATAPLVILPVQIGFGGWTVLAALQPIIVTSHLAFATLIFGSLVALNALAFSSPHRAAPQGDLEPSGAAPGHMTSRPWTGRLQQALGPWVELVKPGILLLLVMCGAAAMFLAGTPRWQLIVATLVGGGFAAMSAATLNNYFDRERDARMPRTKKRSLPSARVTGRGALGFAFFLELASFGILWYYANVLTALLALAGILFYVYYTIWLKPTTAQNIVIGGAAGAAPALVGWAAVTGDLGLPALILGFIIFAWTPPHFWALALVYKGDYEKASIPMYPVVKGDAATHKQILVYAILTVLATLAFVPLGTLGMVYGVVAVVLGGWFVALAIRLMVRKDNKAAYGLFGYSIVYLALLFGAMVVDRILVR